MQMAYSVLLVDDDAAILESLDDLFRLSGFSVTTATSAADAVATLRGSAFEAVVTDMRMETSTAGLDVIRAAKAQAYKPVAIVLTAYPLPAKVWRNAGADGCYLKVQAIDSMVSDLCRMLEKSA